MIAATAFLKSQDVVVSKAAAAVVCVQNECWDLSVSECF